MKKVAFLGLITIMSLCKIYSQTVIDESNFDYLQGFDSLKTIHLNQITIKATTINESSVHLPEVHETVLLSGKKSEVINLSNSEADLSVNNTRQIFGRVPGVNIWENDGSGIQVGIATRGLNPNRSWEFNVRQNGYDISSEVFGYPEAYYNPPMEAVERIEVIRGASALAFGPQFGGLLNYRIKQPNPNKIFEIESRQTSGSYGLFNSFNAIGGTYKNFSYYAFFHNRSANGWRENSNFRTNTGYVNLNYKINDEMKIGLEITTMNYVLQQAGGLTDSMFQQNPQQSVRSRNWFSAPWNIAALTFDYCLNDKASISFKAFGLLAERNSVGYVRPITIKDSINTSLGNYNNRQIDRDLYNNYGAELRFIQRYKLLNQNSFLSLGFRFYNGNTERKQIGQGNYGRDYDITVYERVSDFEFQRHLNFTTNNIAFYAENLFKITERLRITPGIRYENILSSSKGRINNLIGGNISDELTRNVVLLGVSSQYNTSQTTNIYANFNQSFRPILFSEITPSATIEVIDENLKDVKGYNIDFGWRGIIKDFIRFDVGAFYMFYDNRIGTISVNDVPFRTNIGASETKGIESFIEIDALKYICIGKKHNLNIFTSLAFIEAKYVEWNNPAIIDDPEKNIIGKRVEYAPEFIARYGLTYKYKGFTFTYQINKVSDIYTDALNTDLPNATSTIGKLAGYTVMDATFALELSKNIDIRAGVNNLTDSMYSTRRAGGYPGPGLIPSNGRTFFMGVGIKL